MTPEERRIDARFERIETNLERQGAEIDKHTAAIKDLIVVSRTCLTSIQELRDAQKHTDDKLNALIETVDRFLKGLRGSNGKER